MPQLNTLSEGTGCWERNRARWYPVELWLRKQERELENFKRTLNIQEMREILYFFLLSVLSSHSPQVVVAAWSLKIQKERNLPLGPAELWFQEEGEQPHSFSLFVPPVDMVPRTWAQLWKYMAKQTNEIQSFLAKFSKKEEPHGNGKY